MTSEYGNDNDAALGQLHFVDSNDGRRWRKHDGQQRVFVIWIGEGTGVCLIATLTNPNRDEPGGPERSHRQGPIGESTDCLPDCEFIAARGSGESSNITQLGMGQT